MLETIKETSIEGTVSYKLSAALLSELNTSRHLNSIREDVDYWAASFLDPRFKETFENYVTNPEGERRTHDHLHAQALVYHHDKSSETTEPSMDAPCSHSQTVQASSSLSSGEEVGLWFKLSAKMGLTKKKTSVRVARPTETTLQL